MLAPKPLAKPPAPLAQISALPDRVPIEVVEADLAVLRRLAPQGRAAAMTPDQLIERASSAMCGYWRAVLEPMWERVEALVSAEIARCSVALVADGFAAALAGMHHQLSYAAGVITVDTRAHDLRVDAQGCGVWFVPSVFKWPGLLVEHGSREPVISYAARGAGLLWDRSSSEQIDGLTQLIGQSRARILAVLDVPRGTTALASVLDLAPGTVSSHLSVLATAGLLTSRRQGRQVLYARTELAARLLGLSEQAGEPSQTMGTPA
jgi:DNA-binding transcriptional ArsR family regulator